MSESGRLTGRTALVTVVRGIGAAIVDRLVAEGAAVVVADRLGDVAESLAAARAPPATR